MFTCVLIDTSIYIYVHMCIKQVHVMIVICKASMQTFIS